MSGRPVADVARPAVSAALALRRELSLGELGVYVLAQIAGGVAGSTLAHGMFDLPLVQMSVTVRTGTGQWLGEITAAFGLLLTIFGCVRFNPASVPWCVGLYITAAYWFTSSTSFANPAVTIARGLSDTFAGIRPGDVPAFIVAQLVGALAASSLAGWLYRRATRRTTGRDRPHRAASDLTRESWPRCPDLAQVRMSFEPAMTKTSDRA